MIPHSANILEDSSHHNNAVSLPHDSSLHNNAVSLPHDSSLRDKAVSLLDDFSLRLESLTFSVDPLPPDATTTAARAQPDADTGEQKFHQDGTVSPGIE